MNKELIDMYPNYEQLDIPQKIEAITNCINNCELASKDYGECSITRMYYARKIVDLKAEKKNLENYHKIKIQDFKNKWGVK